MIVDFHTHILPGMDDGSADPAESAAMLAEEARQGVDLVVLTPHFYATENSPRQFLARRSAAYQRLMQVIRPEFPQLRLGAEVQYFEGMSRAESLDALRVEGTPLLLLEMPFSNWSGRTVSEVLELNDRQGMQVVLAHVERYLSMQREEVWRTFAENGVLMQASASAFRSWGKRRKIRSMMRDGMIQFFGSDCHNMDDRPPNLNAAYRYVDFDRDTLHDIFNGKPNKRSV